jgi:two-component system phosphate regulon sensor histidine kinase PhoR
MIGRLRAPASSYRLRLILGYVAVTALLGAAWAVSLFGPLTSAVTAQQQTHLANVARADAMVLAGSREPLAAVAARLGTRDLRVTVVAEDGRVLADTRNTPSSMENHAGRPEIAAALRGKLGHDVRRSRTEGVDELYVAVPGTYLGRPVALRVSESLASVAAVAARARATGIALLAAAVLAALLVTVRLSSYAAQPVTRLAATARAIARGDSVPVCAEQGEFAIVSDALADLGQEVRRRIAESDAERETLGAVLDGLDDAVILLESDTVRLANRSASRLFKPPFGGWRGRSLSELELPAPLLAAVRAATTAEGRTVEDVGPDPTGRTLRLTVTSLEAGDGQRQTLVSVADVTERTRLDAMRRDFVANASHELKTPASTIQLLAESADTAARDGDVGQSLAFVSQMNGEASRLRRLVRDLLDLSRLEGVPDTSAISDVRAAVSLAIAAHRPAAERKGLTLEADLSRVEESDVYARLEAADLAVVLDNLLANAVSYTDTGSVMVTVDADDTSVILVVSDTGRGIPAEALPRVFERFYRVDRARSRDAGGTGLGLSLVKHAVERAGGDVAIESAVGEGTGVSLRLPRAL